MEQARRLRVLLAKIGMDGHDRGIKVIARTLRDAGFEVVYLGRRQTPESVARAAAHEDVDVVGISILSGTQHSVARSVVAALKAANVDIPVVMGGTILHREIPDLEGAGVAAVFTVGTKLSVIETWFRELAQRADDAAVS